MTRDDVVRMAREIGLIDDRGEPCVNGVVDLLNFAQLVAAHERAECAKACDEQAKEPECPERAAYCAAAIRARGNV